MFLLLCLFLCLNVRERKKIDCPPKNENVPHNFSQGDKLSHSDQILAQTLPTLLMISIAIKNYAYFKKYFLTFSIQMDRLHLFPYFNPYVWKFFMGIDWKGLARLYSGEVVPICALHVLS